MANSEWLINVPVYSWILHGACYILKISGICNWEKPGTKKIKKLNMNSLMSYMKEAGTDSWISRCWYIHQLCLLMRTLPREVFCSSQSIIGYLSIAYNPETLFPCSFSPTSYTPDIWYFSSSYQLSVWKKTWYFEEKFLWGHFREWKSQLWILVLFWHVLAWLPPGVSMHCSKS